MLFGQWEDVGDGSVRCPHCGTIHVRRKSRQPRLKKYYDHHLELQEVAVCRYYCKNPNCLHKTFTDLPPGSLPYSRWPLSTHLLAVQVISWGGGLSQHGRSPGHINGHGLSLGERFGWSTLACGRSFWRRALQRSGGH